MKTRGRAACTQREGLRNILPRSGLLEPQTRSDAEPPRKASFSSKKSARSCEFPGLTAGVQERSANHLPANLTQRRKAAKKKTE
jgi:hypothetical protein